MTMFSNTNKPKSLFDKKDFLQDHVVQMNQNVV